LSSDVIIGVGISTEDGRRVQFIEPDPTRPVVKDADLLPLID